MKLLALIVLAVLLMFPVSAKQVIYAPYASSTQTYAQLHNITPVYRPGFAGLQGIVGVSVEQPEREYGPQKPFGRPAPKRLRGQAPLPEGYKGLGGIAGPGPSSTVPMCATFKCKPGQYVVGDTSTKEYYRCYCDAAKTIKPENIKCFDTPALAARLGYRQGSC